jgi:hypothetical protein
MGLFSDIMSKLGLARKTAAAATPGTPATPTSGAPAPAPSAAPAQPAPMEMVDVVSKLEGLAKASSERLDWKKSIVDLLKLLGLDSSLAARKGLAAELGCPAEKMADSAEMNMWLHKQMLQQIAKNGGNVPQNLLS